ncbi:hypothetical protein [Pedobacter sp. MR2016-24]|uniref:hypothetical protein n=1 Tax=Pedobacter sp. MR2016-24 TaxID=2994466 RepID=UPI002246AD45|nr:hypothetical protein [Pedobacter sp. MR2016-24]MCX2485027.1 hypothetical protein [Pedobacter sp. MR2016-24]
MKTNDKPSELINQAITNLPKGSRELALKLWECMKDATLIELESLIQSETKRSIERKIILRKLYPLEA